MSIKPSAAMAAVALVALGTVTVASARGNSAGPSPTALNHALLTDAVPASQLPKGFSYSSTRSFTNVGQNGKKHHAVGGAEIVFDNGQAGLIYIVFPTRSDAVADWKDANLKQTAKTTLQAPSGFPSPALIANTSITGKNTLGKTVTNGVTDLLFTSGNVIVQAFTSSTHSTERGDVPGAIELGRFGLKHLQALRTP